MRVGRYLSHFFWLFSLELAYIYRIDFYFLASFFTLIVLIIFYCLSEVIPIFTGKAYFFTDPLNFYYFMILVASLQPDLCQVSDFHF